MKNRKAFFVFLLFFIAASIFAQSDAFPRGAIFDEDAYNKIPQKAELSIRSYEAMPRVYSLKQYAPLPGDQTNYGTCVAWAVAYAARTISESVALNRLNQTLTTQNSFSPVYIYRNIRPDDPHCQYGAQIHWALDWMRDDGAVRMLESEWSIEFPRFDLSLYDESRRYPIAGYVTLFSKDERYKPALVTRIVKKSIAEGKPVIIGMNTPDSFWDAEYIWEPKENPEYYYGGHALCVVGYDDDRGAFEVLNSWGRKWGNGGYIWIPYQVFTDFVTESYELIENLAIYSDTVQFNGFTQAEILSDEGSRLADFTLMPDGIYQSAETFAEGTEFRFLIGAGESAYVYSFAITQSAGRSAGRENFYAPVLLFPQGGVSPILNYRDSIIALPGENKSITIDAETGTEYLITLYSKQALDIHTIMRRFESAQGSVTSRLASAVGKDRLALLTRDENEAAFTAEPDDPRSVAALIVAINHN